MAQVINMLGGASGGLNPQIIVTAPTGSTVTCDGVTGTEVSGTWTFDTTIGTHTIVATLGSSSKTQTVSVTEVAQYPVSISYVPYLYNLGDTCDAITGGWNLNVAWNKGAGTNIIGDSYMQISGSGNISSSFLASVYTNSQIDLSGYAKIKFLVDITNVGGSGAYMGNTTCCGSTSSTPITSRGYSESFNDYIELNKTYFGDLSLHTLTDQIIEIPITNNSYKYVAASINSDNYPNYALQTLKIKKVWLE